MALTQEQIKELKDQLKDQVKSMPEAQKAAALKQIESLSPQALEEMLKQQSKSSKSNKDIFRSIIDGEIPSKKIDENKDNIAVLDIRPISKGHSMIIPKIAIKSTKEIPNSSFSLAKKISKRIIKRLKAKSTEIQTEFKFNEIIINVIPIYDKPLSLDSPRQEGNEKELNEIYNSIKAIKRAKVIKIKKTKSSQSSAIKIDRRIP